MAVDSATAGPLPIGAFLACFRARGEFGSKFLRRNLFPNAAKSASALMALLALVAPMAPKHRTHLTHPYAPVRTLVLAVAWLSAVSVSAESLFVTSKDGTKIAYDVAGSGPAVILLHGGGQNRQVWHRAGYVERLAKEFTVITIDIRGNGDSDKPTDVNAFHFERISEDVLAVADAVKAPQFVLWGFSYGANVGRYLASRSDRVRAMVYIGINFGPAVEGRFLDAVKKMPNAPVWVTAMLSYPPVEPADMRSPTLWLVGSNNEGAMDSAKQYRDRLKGTQVTLEVIDGLNHPQELELIDRIFPSEVEFTRAHSR
jgi:dienelactone hydrolase